MATPAQAARTIRFGVYEVDLRAAELRKNGTHLKLQEQPFQVLCVLLERPGDVISREELRQKLWPADTFVDFDSGLNTAIKKLRDTLGDSADTPRYVETIPRKGYRFIYPVDRGAVAVAPPVPARWRYSRPLLLAGSVLGALALLVALNVFGLRNLIFSVRFPGPVDSVAVLPFNNLTGSADQEYLADGLTDVLTTELAQAGKLRVPSVTTAMYYKRQQKKLPEIASELRVTAVVEGSVQRRGQQVLVSVQLVHGPSDRHIWARTYEGAPQELPTLLARVARDVLNAMDIQLSDDEKARLSEQRPVNREAYEAYLRGLYHGHKGTESGRAKAAAYFQEAIEKDPGFAPAYASLAILHSHGGFYLQGEVSPETMAKTRAMALKVVELGQVPYLLAAAQTKTRDLASKALGLDNTLAAAHLALGNAEAASWDWAGADREYRLAIEMAPNLVTARDWYGQHLAHFRRFDEAIAQVEVALRLAPADPGTLTHAGIVYYEAGQLDKAMDIWRSALELEPDAWAAHQCMGRAYLVKGEYLRAIPHFEASIRNRGQDGVSVAQMGYAYARAGRQDKVREVLDWINKPKITRKGRQGKGGSPYLLRYVYLGLGETDKVIAILEDDFERHKGGAGINSDPLFDSIRTDPRLHDLLRRMGIPEENIGKQPMYPALAQPRRK